jgi:NADH-quinone oxidoreductase subunit C
MTTVEKSENPAGGQLSEVRLSKLLARFPEAKDLVAGYHRAVEAHEREAEEKQRQFQEETERAKAEGKPAPRPAKKEEPVIPRYKTPAIEVPAAKFREVMLFLRDDADLRMDYLSFVSVTDWLDRMECVYHLWSTTHNHEILVKCPVDRAEPRVPSVSDLWSAANWHEREYYDLFGVIFEGHPDLRRIMMTDDWKGHPLRKDYVYEEPDWMVEISRQRQDEIAGVETPVGERS